MGNSDSFMIGVDTQQDTAVKLRFVYFSQRHRICRTILRIIKVRIKTKRQENRIVSKEEVDERHIHYTNLYYLHTLYKCQIKRSRSHETKYFLSSIRLSPHPLFSFQGFWSSYLRRRPILSWTC